MHYVISFYYEEFVHVYMYTITNVKIAKHTYGRTCSLCLLVVYLHEQLVFFSKALIFTCNGTSYIKKYKFSLKCIVLVTLSLLAKHAMTLNHMLLYK